MKITTEYQPHELCKGICKCCGIMSDRLCLESILQDESEYKRFNHMCPGCIEDIKLQELTG